MAGQNVNIAITAQDQTDGVLTSIQRRFSELNAETDRVTRRFSELNSAVASLGGAISLAGIAAMTKSFIDAGMQMEKMTKLFNAASGSANLGAREMEYVRQVAQRMGLEFTSTAESYGKFTASMRNTTLEGEKGRKVFESVSAATTALGLSADETKGVFNALQQMVSKGKVQAEELRGQLGERLPGAFKMAADAMGVTTAELDKMLVDGKLMADDLLPKLAVQLDKTYGKAAKDGASSAAAELNRFKNAIFDTSSTIGQALMPAFAAILRGLTPIVEKVREFIGGFQILSVKAATLPDRLGAAWDVVKTGKGLFSKEGQEQYLKLSAPINAAEDEAINELMRKYMSVGTGYTAAELAHQAGNKPVKPIEKAHKYSRADDLLLKNIIEYQQLVDAQEKGFNQLGIEIEQAAGAANRVFGLSTMQTGELSTSRYNVTPLSKYRLRTNDQYSIPQSAADPEKLAAAAQQARQMSIAMDAELLRSHQSSEQQRLALVEDELSTELEKRIEAANQLQIVEEQKWALMLKAEEAYNAKKAKLTEMSWSAVGNVVAGQLGQISAMMDKENADQFAAYKAMMIAQATIATAMTVAGILGAHSKDLGMLAIPLAFTAGAIGAAQVAIIAAQDMPARAMGGPVYGGTSYLVGERGPEVFTPGASGRITSNANLQKLGGSSANVTQVVQISTGVADTVRAEIGRLLPIIRQQAVGAVYSAINSGTPLSAAVGRM